MTDRHAQLATVLRSLQLSAMATHFTEVAVSAARDGLTHEAFLYELAQLEREHRDQRRIERAVRTSGLPREKTFRTLQVDRFRPLVRQQIEQLRTGTFLSTASNVIAIGKPGVGKSHLAAALGHDLILLGHSVLYTSTYALVQRLLAAKRDLRLPQEVAKLDRFDCLILDDLGYVRKDQAETSVLFELIAERYERRSMITTCNQPFSEWNQIFPDPAMTVAAIDRLVHHATILELNTESYRRRSAASKAAMAAS